jgi:P27 family predicted phage terminase small subunit
MRRKPTLPRPPEHVDAAGQHKWDEVLDILLDRGDILDAGILDGLACYCSAWSQWLAAEAQVKTLGLIVKSPAGFAQENPFLSVARKAQTELRRWGDVLRLTPKAKGKSPKAKIDKATDNRAVGGPISSLRINVAG